VKVSALVHFGVVWRSCGSEVVLHELLKAAVGAGHEAVCWVTHRDGMNSWRGTEPDTEMDGVTYRRVRNSLIGAQELKRWRPDVVVSHHQHVTQAIKTARMIKARSVFLTHNDYDLNKRPMQAGPDLVIHNSEHVAATLNDKFGTPSSSMIFHPPLTPDRHKVESTGDAYTLINLNRDKGAELFYALAKAMPDRKFVGVIGGHGEQVVKRNIPNVEILDHGPDMKRVWSRTRVLLMPSEFESYGLTAVEAGINGVPTIAHPTKGLQENLGESGLFADRDSLDDWVSLIKDLDGQFEYAEASEHARSIADAAMSDTRETLSRWVEWVEGV
jgi:glycosyltransferase involved in cell wall biosynthesis